MPKPCLKHNYVPVTIEENVTRKMMPTTETVRTTRHIVGLCTFCGDTAELHYPAPPQRDAK